jgi:nucleoside-diphosphate-sugar epimerase
MNILLTGASGFLGQYILAELSPAHTVTTLGRTVASERHIGCDLSREEPRLSALEGDCVIHVAGKAHSSPRTEAERNEYEQLNVLGTRRLLSALDRMTTLPEALVYISSVLAYGCAEGCRLDEQTPRKATDTYGKGKAQAEELVRAWSDQHGVRLAILRLPLVAARHPTGNLAALAKAIQRGYYVRLGDGNARRSMVRADDVAAILLRAAAVGGTYNLTDGYHPAVRELEDVLARRANRHIWLMVSLRHARLLARLGDGINSVIGGRFPLNTMALTKLTSSLTFSDDAARQKLGWNPRRVLDLFA